MSNDTWSQPSTICSVAPLPGHGHFFCQVEVSVTVRRKSVDEWTSVYVNQHTSKASLIELRSVVSNHASIFE